MRENEKFVRNSLVSFLGPEVKLIQAEDPPDFWAMESETGAVAVEVTMLTEISYDEKRGTKNRVTEDMYASRLCDELDAGFSSDFPAAYSLILHLRPPYEQPRKLKKEMKRIICEILDDPAVGPGWKRTYSLAGSAAEVEAIPVDPSRRIFGLVSNKDSSPSIRDNAIDILRGRVKAKQKRMSELSWNGSKWLALLNRHPIIDSETFAEAWREVDSVHDFQKVFLVSTDGSVRLLND